MATFPRTVNHTGPAGGSARAPSDAAALDRAALQELARRAPVATGYRLQLLERSQIGAVIALIARWYPDVSVGSASGYLDRRFYQRRVWFDPGPRRSVVVLALRHADQLVGMFSFEMNRQSLSIHARIGVVAPEHRGANLARAGMSLTEAVGRWLGMGMVYGMATLKSPYSQRAFECAGWQLIGIAPGFDRELVAPGVVKRVYEALYAKALVDGDDMLSPQPRNMTQRTRDVFGLLFRAAAVTAPAPR
ncbi:MAG TPA: hypothetical protein VFU71_01115 [Burkholderiaceae bacterium]|nr:hypothetical protein [Burkholderiaceae bacterium]